LRDIDGGNRAHAPGNLERRNATRQSNHAHTAAREHADIFQANRAAADHDSGVAGTYFHFVNATQHASQRLDQRGAAIVDGVRHLEHVLHHDAAGDAHVLGISAIVEKKILAKVFLTPAAVKATQAGRGIGGDDAESEAPPGIDALANGRNLAYHFVAEDGGRLDHFGVITTLPNF
jgi:hypothetical protein